MLTIGLNGRFLGQPLTGVQRYARELATAAAREAGASARVVALTPRGTPRARLPGVEIVPSLSSLPPALWEQIALPREARRLGVDLLWSPCNRGPREADAHVVTVHDAAVFAGPEWFSRWFAWSYQVGLRELGRRARAILTVSGFSRRELARVGVAPADRIHVVPGGVSGAFRPGPVRSAARPTAPYVLALGVHDPRKNLPTLLEAWRRLPEPVRRDRQLAVGGRRFRKFRRGTADPPLPSQARRIGYVPERDLVDWYRGAELFVLPSLYEGFGLPLLEAMACGTPTLAARTGALPEVGGDACRYCDPRDPDDMAAALAELLDQPERRRRLSLAGLRNARRFGWDVAARRLLETFDRIAPVRARGWRRAPSCTPAGGDRAAPV